MRVYVAGPMSNLPELNFPAFHAAAAMLRALGHQVENPAEINPDPSMGWAECMRKDLAVLTQCDAIYLLPGWQNSRGASLESYVAKSLGLVVLNPWILKVTVKQAKVLDFMRQFIADHGKPPPLKTIGFHVGASPAGARQFLKTLQRHGYVDAVGHGKYQPALGGQL
ncbi:DUF4406 domain-containing protein [Variovorax paradoxus]|nr:DUF4406 domain-containing protein [Variovorax paradoxus]MBT2299249.1 DUF4406 domain-containing protein [Variovorax paradoxus]